MATNLDLDDKLIEDVRRAFGFKTKKETVTAALRALLRQKKQREIIKLFGTVDYDPAYDYKAWRRRKRGWQSS